mgnify:FL=1
MPYLKTQIRECQHKLNMRTTNGTKPTVNIPKTVLTTDIVDGIKAVSRSVCAWALLHNNS